LDGRTTAGHSGYGALEILNLLFFLMVRGFEGRASHLLGRCYST
jgi:hypothetical protein